MCGILLCFNKKGINTDLFQESLNLQIHRGPDSQKIYCSDIHNNKTPQTIDYFKKQNINNPTFMAGFNRLSILDLSDNSNQPVLNDEKNKMLLFNGEFYNYLQYADNKNNKSDTLTLFNLLNTRNADALNLINGMWAISYIDFQRKTIIFSRDRYGKKPLFYYHDKDQLIISSEYKSIFNLLKTSRKVNLESLAYFFISKLAPYKHINNNTFYKEIKSFETGSYTVYSFEKNEFIKTKKINFPKREILNNNQDEMKELIYKDFINSVERRLLADTKVGVMVSGGIDSSAIACVAAKSKKIKDIEFFTAKIFRNNKISEDEYYSKYLSDKLGVKLNIIDVDPHNYDDFFKNASEITRFSELPNNFSLASIPTYLVTKTMKDKNFKVSIDGIGGDEVFGGYPSSFQSLAIANIRSLKYIQAINYYLKWCQFYTPKLNTKIRFFLSILIRHKYLNLKKDFHNNEVMSQISRFKNKELLNNIFNLENNFFTRNKMPNMYDRQKFEIKNHQIPYYTGVADNLSMANSIENRSPFLDLELNKYVNLNDKFKYNKGMNKYLFRKTISKIMPEKILNRTGDSGIGTCYNAKMLTSNKSLDLILDSDFIKNIFNEKIIISDFNDRKILTRSLFSIALLDNIYKLSV